MTHETSRVAARLNANHWTKLVDYHLNAGTGYPCGHAPPRPPRTLISLSDRRGFVHSFSLSHSFLLVVLFRRHLSCSLTRSKRQKKSLDFALTLGIGSARLNASSVQKKNCTGKFWRALHRLWDRKSIDASLIKRTKVVYKNISIIGRECRAQIGRKILLLLLRWYWTIGKSESFFKNVGW